MYNDKVRSDPVPHPEAYRLYWYFASERQRAFEMRVSGELGPWTDDPILQEYKFCNVFRAADRVSQYLISNVAYSAEPCSPDDRVFQIVAFRTFSRIETWEALRDALGRSPTLVDLESGAFGDALTHLRGGGGPIYTGAFILCATDAYGQGVKHLNHVELFRDMFLHRDLAGDVQRAESLREVYDLLHQFPLMGDFMSYQTAIDLNYSEFLNFSESEFTKPGPGALRGIKKCFISLGDYTPSDIIQWMVEHQEQEFERLGLPFNGLWGRRLQAIDCQGLFCETDKYCRVALPEISSARKRIKARFSPHAQPIQLFFPPKWEINSKLPSSPVLGSSHSAGADGLFELEAI